jgi:hypothetical protein
MDLQYPGDEGELIQFPSSDIDRDPSTVSLSSPPLSPNAFSQEPDFRFSESDRPPSEFDLGKPIPLAADLDSSESDLVGDEQSLPADPTEFHPLINGMYYNESY